MPILIWRFLSIFAVEVLFNLFYIMVNQTLISFKCDTGQLARFDELCMKLGCKRNKLLNFLVNYANVCLSSPDKLNLMRAYSSVCFDDD